MSSDRFLRQLDEGSIERTSVSVLCGVRLAEEEDQLEAAAAVPSGIRRVYYIGDGDGDASEADGMEGKSVTCRGDHGGR